MRNANRWRQKEMQKQRKGVGGGGSLRAKKDFARAAHFSVHFFAIVLHDFNVRETS